MPISASGAPVAAFYTLVPAPWGPIHVAATDRALVALEILTPTDSFLARLERRLGVAPQPVRDGRSNGILREAVTALGDYLDGSVRGLDLAVELVGLSDWDRRVLGVVRSIPSHLALANAAAYSGRIQDRPAAAIPWHGASYLRFLPGEETLLAGEGISLPPVALFGA